VIVPLVEGFAEVESVPELLRRLLWADGIFDINVATPFRVKRNKVVKPGEIERAVTLAVNARVGARAAIIILDADDDCPCRLGPALLARADAASTVPTAVVLACREYECWLLGAKESLRGTRGIREDASTPPNPESIRDGKGRLRANMGNGRGYVEVEDQTALTAVLDLDTAERNCPSFGKLRRELRRLVEEIGT
jgi:hypothetical protein